MAPPPCGSVSGHAHVTGLGVWGPLPAAPWQHMHARAVAPLPPVGICRAHTERATVCMSTRHSTGFGDLAALGTTRGESHHPHGSSSGHDAVTTGQLRGPLPTAP